MDINELKNIFSTCEIIDDKILVKSDLKNIIDFIKCNYKFDILKSITAVDNIENVELIYHLSSTENEEDIKISISVNEHAESVSSLFDSAIADEKEIYDLFGINFIGNSELKRLYMPEAWNGHPLRKDYVENDERLIWND
jgi:NADH-quinone oxidoreductase subunit C